MDYKKGLPTTNLINDGDQGSAEISELHVGDFVENVLTITDLIQQQGHLGARVDTILSTAHTTTDSFLFINTTEAS